MRQCCENPWLKIFYYADYVVEVWCSNCCYAYDRNIQIHHWFEFLDIDLRFSQYLNKYLKSIPLEVQLFLKIS